VNDDIAAARNEPELAEIIRKFYADKLNPQSEALDPWVPFTLKDCYQERDPIKHIAGNVFDQGSLNVVYGSPGTLKSFLLADLFLCVAAGKPWLQPAPWQSDNTGNGLQTMQTPGLWLDFDNGQRRTLDRFSALGKGHNLPDSLDINIYSMPSPWLKADDLLSVEGLIKRAKGKQAGLIVIDNLGSVRGEVDENSAAMTGTMSNLRRLADETGAAVILIHHQRKSNGILGRVGESLRGSSSIEAALDTALQVEREPGSQSVTITATKDRGVPVLPFMAEFTFETESNKARFFGLAIEDMKSDLAIEREVLDALKRAPLNKSDLTKAIKDVLPDIGLNRIRNSIDRLSGSNRINLSQGNHGAKVYSCGH